MYGTSLDKVRRHVFNTKILLRENRLSAPHTPRILYLTLFVFFFYHFLLACFPPYLQSFLFFFLLFCFSFNMRPLFCAFVCVCARLPAFFYILLSLTSLQVGGFCYFSTFSLVKPTFEFRGLKSVYFVNSIIKVKYLPKNGLRTFFKRPYCVAALFKKKKVWIVRQEWVL